jgi:hypothetical protein
MSDEKMYVWNEFLTVYESGIQGRTTLTYC